MQSQTKTLFAFIAALLLSAIAFPASATNLPAIPAAPRSALIPPAPKVAAKAYIVLDATNGKILAEKNADRRLSPASLTKMMTMYIVSSALADGRIQLDEKVRISRNAWHTGGSKMFVRVGQRVPVAKLIEGIIVASGNDACVAMAEHVAGSEDAFVSLMNQEAKRLGMNHTHFVDSTGMPQPKHYTTPRDLGILARALVHDFPEDYHRWYHEKWFSFSGIRQPNRNRLLWHLSYVDGIKTGHTDDAGYCLVSSGEQNGMRLISVVMATPSDQARTVSSEQLLNYGFRFYEGRTLYPANQSLTSLRTWGGEHKTIALGSKKSIYVTIPRGRKHQVTTTLTHAPSIKAPIQKGQVLGKLVVNLDGQPMSSEDLVALEGNPRGGLWTRTKDYFLKTFHFWAEGRHHA